MYPHVSLTIDKYIPAIVYHPQEGVEKKLTTKDENIYNTVYHVADRLGLIKDQNLSTEEQFESILAAARESDENYLTELTDINPEELEFNLANTMSEAVEKALKKRKNDYEDIEMSEELRNELNTNQNKDTLASILDAMYMLLIAKTVVAAAELGIGRIALNDSTKNARLHEKMLQELHKLGIEYISGPIDLIDLQTEDSE